MRTLCRTILGAGVATVLLAGSLTTGAFAQAGPEGAPPAAGAPEAAPPAPAPEPEAPAAPTLPRARRVEPSDETVARAAATPVPGSGGKPSSDGILASFNGPIGLYRLSLPDTGPVGGFRFGVHGEYFSLKNLLVQGDTDRRLQGSFVFGWTPVEHLELFAALLASSNDNKRNLGETDRRDPEVIKSFGDFIVGPKVSVPLPKPGLNLAFELGLKFVSSISGLSFSSNSTSFWIGPVFAADLREINDTPLRFTVNANYFQDNSGKLNPFSTGAYSLFTKEVSLFAYGIAKSRMRVGLGVDAPLEKQLPQLPLQPFIEYHFEYITAGADADFKDYMKPYCKGGTMATASAKDCRENKDMHWLTLGLRSRVYKAVTLDLGLDVNMRSVGFPYGPPMPQWQFLFGASFPLDVEGLRRVEVVTKTVDKVKYVEKPAAAPPTGYVRGLVKSARGSAPVPGAIVAVTGKPQMRAATDPDGTFRTLDLAPGPVEMEVTAPNFDAAKASAVVAAGKPTEIEVTLTPRAPTGNVRGRVADDQGRGVEASIKFMGPDNFEARSDGSGTFSAALPVGTYQMHVDATNFLNKEAQVEVVQGQDRSIDFVVRTRPASSAVAVSASGITTKMPIKWKGATDTLDASAMHVLDEVVDAVVNHPELKKLRIQAHWDASLAKPKADDLTRRQAEAIKAYMMKQGIPESRLEAAGMGSSKPLVPNIGAANKAKNRRVEFVSGS